MSHAKEKLRDPVYAAILAFLVPGLGHFYQRRLFKGALYSICILGTFFTGMRIGHGQVVYFNWQSPENRTWAYLGQFWAGLPALPALAQAKFRSPEMFEPNYVPESLSAEFVGELKGSTADGKIRGRIAISPEQPGGPRTAWTAKLSGTLETPQGSLPIEGAVLSGILEPAVAPWPRRKLRGSFDGRAGEGDRAISGRIEGSIPRPMWNSYGAPLQERMNELTGESDLDLAHKQLGSRFELGVVYTMIAGLLNILAIYDALEGPAYEDEDEDEKEKSDRPPPAPA